MNPAPPVTPSVVTDFISRWQRSGAAERANYALFLTELCDLLGVPHPDPAQPDDTLNAYIFERSVTFHHADGTSSAGRIDLYRRGCFVLEAKQGVERKAEPAPLSAAHAKQAKAAKKGTAVRGTAAWDVAMLAARGQGESYIRALPPAEGRPPFLMVVDVGHCIEVYAEFSRTGGTYIPFPDPRSHRISMDAITRDEVRDRLRRIWLDPNSLDPARRSAQVTREIATKLARLAQSLEKSGHAAETVAGFLMRALFTMFAEDVELLPANSFRALLETLRGPQLEFLVPALEELWSKMNTGGLHIGLRAKILRFNGGLFADARALPLSADQLELLIEAASTDWREVEPAIFGTLLERALDPVERHRLGAHYTPRLYVERLVMPTIVEPLRAEWDAARVAALTEDRAGKRDNAIAELQRFHRRLCEVNVLDPACGSGNFLYVTMEHLKRLEGEVLNDLAQLGEEQARLEMQGFTVDPHQLLGLELNPRAAAIAELVLWIGYLQWHFRTRGRVAPPEPVIKAFHNIQCRDAVLAADGTEPVLDARGQASTRWDGRTKKTHPVTGEAVPDETARVPVLRYINPRPAEWPKADFIVGNPPYIGVRRLKESVGDEYVETLRSAYPEVPETSDYVMYWWEKAALAVASGVTRRFGLITTNSIVQAYSRRLLERHIGEGGKIKIAFAIPNHPWVDAADGAAVGVAMTVGCPASEPLSFAQLGHAGSEENDPVSYQKVTRIGTSLDATSVHEKIEPLESNAGMCFQGVVPAGDGFKLEANELAALGFSASNLPPVIRRYIIGRDLVQRPEVRYIIDLFGLSDAEARKTYPSLYQHLRDRVFPEREQNKRAAYRERWWIFAEPRPAMRRALAGLSRYVATPYTAKFRPFVFVNGATLPDAMVYAIASDDAFVLGVLSSRIHHLWALATGGTLEDRPRYNSNATFFPFPFPDASGSQRSRIRELGESIDAHRKRQQAQHPHLTLTDLYNVLDRLRAKEPLTPKERNTHDLGLMTILLEHHDQLDAAVLDAYGFPPTISDDELLANLCMLNAERAAEEQRGHIRWLRPSFQASAEAKTKTAMVAEPAPNAPIAAKQASPNPWPKALAQQAQVVRDALAKLGCAADAKLVASQFKPARTALVADLLATLASLGQARALPNDRYIIV